MKLIRAEKDLFTFHVEKREKRLLFQILRLYPLIPPSHQRLSKTATGSAHDENQRLLEESLAAQRAENRRQVLAMLDEAQRLREMESGFEFSLSAAQVEWLLQTLNDVRVGSWLALGEPEAIDTPRPGESNAAFVVAMEAAGYFESVLVEAFGEQSPVERGET